MHLHRKSLVVAFLAGAFAAVALMILFTAGRILPRAEAQEAPPARGKIETLELRHAPEGQAPAAAPRYQISAWGSNVGPGQHGAFVIDTRTGEIWQYDGPHAPLRVVGKVPAK